MHYLDTKLPSGVVSQYLLSCDGDIEGTKGQGPSLWPVLVTLDPISLHQIGDHHNALRPLLPHHPPEVNSCVRQWSCSKHLASKTAWLLLWLTLCCYELVLKVVSLYIE